MLKVFKGITLYILLLEIMVKVSKYHDIIKDLKPDDYTMDEINKNLAIYNRLYYLKMKQQEGWIENKREKLRRTYRQKAIEQMIKDDNIKVNELSSPYELLDALTRNPSK